MRDTTTTRILRTAEGSDAFPELGGKSTTPLGCGGCCIWAKGPRNKPSLPEVNCSGGREAARREALPPHTAGSGPPSPPLSRAPRVGAPHDHRRPAIGPPHLYCLTDRAPAGCWGKPDRQRHRYRSRLPWSKRCCRRTSLVPGSTAIPALRRRRTERTRLR